jgi:hypothetical protein
MAFTLLGVITLTLERANPAWLTPVRTLIGRYLFATYETTGAFLGAVGGGLITMTSIIFSMLLLMLQQSASNRGNYVPGRNGNCRELQTNTSPQSSFLTNARGYSVARRWSVPEQKMGCADARR